jgi:hypothetical protein
MPPLPLGPEMPLMSHILRFYSSIATVLVHPEVVTSWKGDEYRFLVSDTEFEVARVHLDSHWSGIGKAHSLVYISRHCNEYTEYIEEICFRHEGLHLLLIESVPGWGEVKRRVQLVQDISIFDWRKANPKWELVSLA